MFIIVLTIGTLTVDAAKKKTYHKKTTPAATFQPKAGETYKLEYYEDGAQDCLDWSITFSSSTDFTIKAYYWEEGESVKATYTGSLKNGNFDAYIDEGVDPLPLKIRGKMRGKKCDADLYWYSSMPGAAATIIIVTK